MADCSTTLKHISIACFTGFIGDAMLQALTKFWNMGGKTGWGLIEYFRLHGAAESMFIASGMMTLFYVLYLVVFGFPAPRLTIELNRLTYLPVESQKVT